MPSTSSVALSVNPFGPGHHHGLCHTLSPSWILKQFSFVCISLSFSKAGSHFMVEPGWRGECGQFSPSYEPCADHSGKVFAREELTFFLSWRMTYLAKNTGWIISCPAKLLLAFLLGEATRDNACVDPRNRHIWICI